MSISVETKPLVGRENSDANESQSVRIYELQSDNGSPFQPGSPSKTYSSPTNGSPGFSKFFRRRLTRSGTSPQIDSQASLDLDTMRDDLTKTGDIRTNTLNSRYDSLSQSPLVSARLKDSPNLLNSARRFDSKENEKTASPKNLWKLLLSSEDVRRAGSGNLSASSSPRINNGFQIRRQSSDDFTKAMGTQETQREDEKIPKKPGADFTVEHFKLLRRQIENEKLRLQKDIQEAAIEENQRKASSLSLSTNAFKKWEKAKANVLAMTRLNKIKENLSLWGRNMEVNTPNKEPKSPEDPIPEEKEKVRFLFYPQGKFVLVWSVIYFIIMIYTAFITPYRIAFLYNLPTWWAVIEQIIDVIFFCDILVTLNSAKILENGETIDNRKEIFLDYLKGWLFVDLIAIFPFSLFISENEKGYDFNTLIKLVRLPRLYKFTRLTRIFKVTTQKTKRNKYFQNIQDSLHLNITSVRIIKFLIVLFLSVHVFACLWFIAARFFEFKPGTWVYELELTEESNMSLYITSVYWVVSTVTTVGFGDLHAFNDLERLLSILWIIIGVGFYSLNIGAMTSLLANKDTREGNLSTKLVLMDEFAKETGLPSELRLKIKRTLEYNSLRSVFNQFERNEFFEEIPIDVKSEMAEVMHRGVITKLKFFKNKDRVFIATMVPLLQPLKVSKGEVIYRTGEYPINIYFIVSGRVNIVVGAHMLNLKTYVQGSYFGEIEMVNNSVRQSTLRAEVDCELLTLSRKAFLRLMDDFPNYGAEIKAIAEERQIRIAEALRKIKQLLPISSNSKFWEKRRDHSLYDLEASPKNKFKDFEQESQADNDRFQTSLQQLNAEEQPQPAQVSPKNIQHQGSIESKIDEVENEDDEEDVRIRADIPREILENKEAGGKIANLINANELKQEQNNMAKFISKIYSEKHKKQGRKISDHLSVAQLNNKLLQAEGDASKKRSVLIVKGSLQKANNPDSQSESPLSRRSHLSAVNVSHDDTQKKIENRRSYFSRSNQNTENPAQSRRSLSIKPNRLSPKRSIGSFINRLFDTQKQPEENKSNIEPNLSEECSGGEIDVLEIETNVIQNFARRSTISHTKKVVDPKTNKNDVSDRGDAHTLNYTQTKSSPTQRVIDNSNTKDRNIEMNNSDRSSRGQGQFKDIRNKQNENIVEAPRTVVVVEGNSFEKKIRRDRSKSFLTPEDEDIPGIALGIVGAKEPNRRYRLSIYDPLSSESAAHKVLKSIWGHAHPDLKHKEQKGKSPEDVVIKRRKQDQEQYKINIIAPETSPSLGEPEKTDPNKLGVQSGLGFLQADREQENATPIHHNHNNYIQNEEASSKENELEAQKEEETSEESSEENKNYSEKSKTYKSDNDQDLQENQKLKNEEVAETKEIQIEGGDSGKESPEVQTIYIKSQSTLTAEDLKNFQQSQKEENQVNTITFDNDLNSFNPQGFRKGSDITERKGTLKIPLLELISEERSSQTSSQVSIDSNCDPKFPIKNKVNHIENFNKVETQNKIEIEQKVSRGSKIMSNNQLVVPNLHNKESSNKEKEDAAKTDLQNRKRRGTLRPSIMINSLLKKEGDEENKFDTLQEPGKGKDEEAKQHTSSKKNVSKKDRTRRKSKMDNNRYKQKYKKQAKAIDELFTGFKDIKNEFNSMEKDVGSIQNRLNNLEKLMDSFQDLITQFSNKVQEQNGEAKNYRKVPSIEKVFEKDQDQDSISMQTLVFQSKSDQILSPIYMPQKKTIVFAFQKPEPKITNFMENEEKRLKEEHEIDPDQMLALNQDNQEKTSTSPTTDLGNQGLVTGPDSSTPKPQKRRIPKLRKTGVKGGFQVLQKDMTYGSDDESDSFLNRNFLQEREKDTG